MFSDIVVIVGVPRSGTSWLGQIVDSCPDVRYQFQPIFSYVFKDSVNKDSTKKEYKEFFEKVYKSENDFLRQTVRKKKGIYPLFEKKNENPSVLAIKMVRYHYLVPYMLKYFDNLKGVGIIRHPCGVINSWLSHPKEFPSGADVKKEWRYGDCRNKGHPEECWGFEAWKRITELYMSLEEVCPDRFKILKYEDIVEQPLIEIKNLFNFLDLRYTQQTVHFLKKSQECHVDDPYGVYKNKKVKDKWKWQLDIEIKNEIINELKDTKFDRFL